LLVAFGGAITIIFAVLFSGVLQRPSTFAFFCPPSPMPQHST
jgi:hypothetical protein